MSPTTTVNACIATPVHAHFEEGAVHTADPDLLPALRMKKTSCISSSCHDAVHDVRNLKDAKFWKGSN